MKRKFLAIDIRMFVDKYFVLDKKTAIIFKNKIIPFIADRFVTEDFIELDERNKAAYRKFLNRNDF